MLKRLIPALFALLAFALFTFAAAYALNHSPTMQSPHIRTLCQTPDPRITHIRPCAPNEPLTTQTYIDRPDR